MMDNLKIEMTEAFSFNDFKNAVEDGVREMTAFDELRKKEKDYSE